jgi:replicative DNA helicase
MMDQESHDHVPYDLEVEAALLGSILVDNGLIDIASADLEPEQFYEPLHQRLFEMCVHLATEGQVTPLILYSVMKTDPGLQEVGGIGYITSLMGAAPAVPGIKEMVRVIADRATRRTLIQIGENLVNSAYDDPVTIPAHQIASDAASAILDAGEDKQNTTVSLSLAIGETIQVAEAHLSGGKRIRALPTGLSRLDDAIGGIQPCDRIAIAGRTGMGKSILASDIANGVALSGAPVLILSADMRRAQWSGRAACELAQRLYPDEQIINFSKFRKGTLTGDDLGRLSLARGHIQELPIFLDDNPKITLPSVRGRLRAMARRFKGQQGLLVVDFLQKVEPPKARSYKDRRRDEDLTQISYDLGDFVADVGWSLLALVQLKNKETDSEGTVATKPPTVADIRESGGIEMAFDIVIGMFRPGFPIEHNTRKSWPDKIAELKETHSASGFATQNVMQLLGFKNRDASSTDLDLNFWCDMRCGAVRDEEPWSPAKHAADLLNYGAPV